MQHFGAKWKKLSTLRRGLPSCLEIHVVAVPIFQVVTNSRKNIMFKEMTTRFYNYSIQVLHLTQSLFTFLPLPFSKPKKHKISGRFLGNLSTFGNNFPSSNFPPPPSRRCSNPNRCHGSSHETSCGPFGLGAGRGKVVTTSTVEWLSEIQQSTVEKVQSLEFS